MAKADLTAARLRAALNYDPDTGVFTRRGMVAGSSRTDGYLQIWVGAYNYKAHRLAWLYVTGQWPADVLDHIDGDRTNNRFANLRDVSRSVNMQNQRKAHSRNANGLLGATFEKRRELWRAQIWIDGEYKYLGRFASPELAHAAYITAKREQHPGCTI